MNKAMREWADEVVASGENSVHGENDVSVRIVRMLADNPGILANVRDALLYAESASGEHLLANCEERMDEAYVGYSVEVVIFKVAIPAGKTYNEAVEYNLMEEYTLTAFSDLEDADEYAEKLYKEHTKYPSA